MYLFSVYLHLCFLFTNYYNYQYMHIIIKFTIILKYSKLGYKKKQKNDLYLFINVIFH